MSKYHYEIKESDDWLGGHGLAPRLIIVIDEEEDEV